MKEKVLVFLFCAILLSPLVLAQSIQIEFPEDNNNFAPGEKITFKINLYDDQSNLVYDEVLIILEDSEKKSKIEQTFNSKDTIIIDLGETATSGQGTITVKYQDHEEVDFFEIGRKELARFSLDRNKLLVTNMGNTQYTRTIKITIGQTTGTKSPSLSPGESIVYNLVAPEGNYEIRVDDGISPALTKGGVRLTGTGQAIGALDQNVAGRTPLTGGISPDEDSEMALLSYVKDNKFVYVFVFVIFGATILLAIERRSRKKRSKK